jgi:hypothetical protein
MIARPATEPATIPPIVLADSPDESPPLLGAGVEVDVDLVVDVDVGVAVDVALGVE